MGSDVEHFLSTIFSSRAASSGHARLFFALLHMMKCTHPVLHPWLADVGSGCFAALLEVRS
jgi:hypothetical protein